MEVVVLASGSTGNATLIRSGEDAILVDAGISARALGQRLESCGVSPQTVQAVVVTHEHTDHSSGLAVATRRFGWPVWATAGTWSALAVVNGGRGGELKSGREHSFGRLRVLPVATSHDAAEPIALVVDDGAHRLALCTDTGIVTQLIVQRLAGCDALLLEANHDADMLRHGPYPWSLKQRIASRHGHLANHQAAEAVGALRSPALRAVVALHLSETNNSPALTFESLRAIVPGDAALGVASRSEMVHLELDGGETRMDLIAAPVRACRSGKDGR